MRLNTAVRGAAIYVRSGLIVEVRDSNVDGGSGSPSELKERSVELPLCVPYRKSVSRMSPVEIEADVVHGAKYLAVQTGSIHLVSGGCVPDSCFPAPPKELHSDHNWADRLWHGLK